MKRTITIITTAIATAVGATTSHAAETKKPNVLFIAVDDLNDWIGCLGGHPQSVTPNFDKLAKSGQLYTNAHCIAPSCNPSRSGVMLGISPHKSGIYANGQKMREVLPQADLLPKHFSNHGYSTGGAGKMLHYFTDAQSWDEYYPKKESERPIPWTLYPEKRPVSLKKGGAWQYVETDWGPLKTSDKAFGGDYSVSEWVGKKLRTKQEKPFFLACGIYRPHEPWFVPQKYFDKFPLESVKLPIGYKADDLDDLPPTGKRIGPNRYFKHIRSQKQWRQGVQGYLASIHFADAMLGRVLDALEEGPNKNNTIVVLWSDHGWHLGEKQHWQKYTAWRASTRVPLMIKVPKACSPTLPNGTQAGTIYDDPVSLLSLYNTVNELCGIPLKKNDSVSIFPTLKDPTRKQNDYALTFIAYDSTAVSGTDWRYIRYPNGDQELYNIKEDPYEWHNLATFPEHTERMKTMATAIPKTFAKYVPPSHDALAALKWEATTIAYPDSSFDGPKYNIVFMNKGDQPVQVAMVNKEKSLKPMFSLASGSKKIQKAESGTVWVIQNSDKSLRGYFRVTDRNSKAVIQ